MAAPPRSDVRITVFHLSEDGDRDSEGGGKDPAAHPSGAFQSVLTAQSTQSGRSAPHGASKRRERERERDAAGEYDLPAHREPDVSPTHNPTHSHASVQPPTHSPYPNRERRRGRERLQRGVRL